MAIYVRRGMEKDFDPEKMKAGEWAVSVDPDRKKQKIWMCFAPGVVKRLGTYEDFIDQIAEINADMMEQYIKQFNDILKQVENDKDIVASDYEFIAEFKKILEETYMPNINTASSNATSAAQTAQTAQEGATESATQAAESARQAEIAKDSAQKYSANALKNAQNAQTAENKAASAASDAVSNAMLATTSRDTAKMHEDNARKYMEGARDAAKEVTQEMQDTVSNNTLHIEKLEERIEEAEDWCQNLEDAGSNNALGIEQLKEKVEHQTNLLKEDIVDLENLVAIKSPNLFDTSRLVNKSISDTGAVVTNKNTCALLNIPITHGQSIVFNGFLNRTDLWYGFVYNSKGELISRFGLTNYNSSYAGDASFGHYGNKYTAVDGAEYFSIYAIKTAVEQGTKHQLEYGDTLSEYKPYGTLSFKYADEIDKIQTKQDKLVAGRGINIAGNTIACTIESDGSSAITYESESRLLNDTYSTLAEIDPAVVLPFAENNIVNEKAKFLFGSHKIKTQNNYYIKSIDKTITNVDKGGVLEIAFEYDGVAFEIGGFGLTTYRFKIDEGDGWKYLDEKPLHVSTKNGYRTYTQIRFSFATHRKIIIETSDSVWCLRYDANYQIFPLSSIKPLALFVGSSITEGSAAGEFPMASYGAVCSNEMGWEYINLGVGARGLLSAPENKYSIKDSIPDITQFTLADYVFIGGSINDSGYASNPDDLISGVKGIIEAIKTKLPRAKVIVLGTWSPQPDGNNTSHKITNDAIKSAALSSGCAFVDSMNSVVYDENGNIVQNSPGWVTGTFLHLSGDDEMSTIGNCARIYYHENGSIDHTHPGRIGHYYIGMRLASVCRALKLK